MERSCRLILPGNFKKYIDDLVNGSLRGLALTCDRRLALEMIQEGKMLSIILADPKNMVVEHTCRFMDIPGTAGCKHLAAAVDAMAFLKNTRLVITEGRPLAKVTNVNRYVQKGEVVCCRDMTADYMVYRGMAPKAGDFKLLSFAPEEIAALKSASKVSVVEIPEQGFLKKAAGIYESIKSLLR